MRFKFLRAGRAFIEISALCLAIVIISFIPMSGGIVSANESFLPAGMSWGMTESECTERLLESGYLKKRPEIPTSSPDRTLRRFALVNGIRSLGFERSSRLYAENLSISLYNDGLYLISQKYGDFGSGFKQEAVSSMAENIGSDPRLMRGLNSDMEVYAWTKGATSAQFSYRELPELDIYFAETMYRHVPVALELKRLGLQ